MALDQDLVKRMKLIEIIIDFLNENGIDAMLETRDDYISVSFEDTLTGFQFEVHDSCIITCCTDFDAHDPNMLPSLLRWAKKECASGRPTRVCLECEFNQKKKR